MKDHSGSSKQQFDENKSDIGFHFLAHSGSFIRWNLLSCHHVTLVWMDLWWCNNSWSDKRRSQPKMVSGFRPERDLPSTDSCSMTLTPFPVSASTHHGLVFKDCRQRLLSNTMMTSTVLHTKRLGSTFPQMSTFVRVELCLRIALKSSQLHLTSDLSGQGQDLCFSSFKY